MTKQFRGGVLAAVSVAAVSAVVWAQQAGVDPRPPNAPNQKPAFEGQTRAPERKTNVALEVVTVAEGLQAPWSLEFVANFKETALANGILEQARLNAEGELRRLLTLLGYRDIQFAK